MLRGPRLDILDGLYHVIARGEELRDIFRTDRDREDFLNRPAVVVAEEPGTDTIVGVGVIDLLVE